MGLALDDPDNGGLALESLALNLLDDHVRHCVAGALGSGDAATAEEKSRELLEAVQRFARTH